MVAVGYDGERTTAKPPNATSARMIASTSARRIATGSPPRVTPQQLQPHTGATNNELSALELAYHRACRWLGTCHQDHVLPPLDKTAARYPSFLGDDALLRLLGDGAGSAPYPYGSKDMEQPDGQSNRPVQHPTLPKQPHGQSDRPEQHSTLPKQPYDKRAGLARLEQLELLLAQHEDVQPNLALTPVAVLMRNLCSGRSALDNGDGSPAYAVHGATHGSSATSARNAAPGGCGGSLISSPDASAQKAALSNNTSHALSNSSSLVGSPAASARNAVPGSCRGSLVGSPDAAAPPAAVDNGGSLVWLPTMDLTTPATTPARDEAPAMDLTTLARYEAPASRGGSLVGSPNANAPRAALDLNGALACSRELS